MKNLLVIQSGGPTAVINSSLAGVIKCGFDRPEKIGKVYGGLNGIEGVEKEHIIDLDLFKSCENLKLLKQTPSSYLGSCRKRLPEFNDEISVYERLFSVFEKYNIGYLCCIGGNDSMDTTSKLSEYAEKFGKELRVVGIPKTVDNDLALTDHSPGYGSAAKFVANCMRQLALDTDVYQMPSAVIVEAMGRNAGWLTAASALSNSEEFSAVDIICLPERVFDAESFIKKVESVSKEKKTVMIAVSEGIKDKNGNYITADLKAQGVRGDKFGHMALGGAGKAVEALISENMGIKTRSIELSTLQRCFSAQASLCDVEEAFWVGYEGAELALKGESGVMAGFKRVSEKPYQSEVISIPVKKVANFEKKIPYQMINSDGFGVNKRFFEYALPLISGEPELIYKDGCLAVAPVCF